MNIRKSIRKSIRQSLAASSARLLFVCCLLFVCLLFDSLVASKALAQENAESQSQREFLEQVESAAIQAIAKAEQSVVAIARVPLDRAPTDRVQRALLLTMPIDFEDPLSDPNFVPSFYGTGVVVSQSGHIVTCAHLLDDPEKNRYYIWLNKRSYRAKVVGKSAVTLAADPFSDLAILKIEPEEDLVPIQFAAEDSVKKGQFVVALGNPDAIARDGRASASWGMVSNLDRFAPSEFGQTTPDRRQTIHEFGTLIQSDAAAKLSCSGGALINLDGEMIGLTTTLSVRPNRQESAGFAIPTDKLFRRVLNQLKRGKLPEYGFLGIEPTELQYADRIRGRRGARVSTVIEGLPGALAGLRKGDIIRRVAEKDIHNSIDLFRELSMAEAGQSVVLEVDRIPYGAAGQASRLELDALVSKKYVATTRPAYSIHPREAHRGMVVEYTTAIPSSPVQIGALPYRGEARPKIAFLDVELGSAAWQAGLRPGMSIHSLGGTPISSPEEFYEKLPSEGEVDLVFLNHRGIASRLRFGASKP